MKYFLSLLFIAALFNGCYYDNLDEMHPAPPPCDTSGTISFNTDILPIMNGSCGGQNSACHNGDASSSGYGLGNYTDVINSINNSGRFMETITHSTSISSSIWMPKGTSSKIDECSIAKIQKWFDNGKLNN